LRKEKEKCILHISDWGRELLIRVKCQHTRERATRSMVARPSPMWEVWGLSPVKDFLVRMRRPIAWGWWLSHDETINRGPVCIRIQNIKHTL
jgi:hypothetical protein